MTEVAIIDASEILTIPGENGVVGRGGFGTVRLCKTKNLGLIAVKCYQVTGHNEAVEDHQRKLMNEAKILKKFAHKNIMTVYGISLWSAALGILTEYLPGGNLEGLILVKKVGDIAWTLRLRIALELSEAISFLHTYRPSKALVHGDIKPGNILLTHRLSVKLADFGSANMAACTGASTVTLNLPKNKQHTPYYTAPEFLRNCLLERTPAMDVYSFAMVLYEILVRMRVFQNASLPIAHVLQVICDMGQRPDQRPIDKIKESLTGNNLTHFDEMVNAMINCWSQEPNKRPAITTVRDSLQNRFNAVNEEVLEEQVRNVVRRLNLKTPSFNESRAVTLRCFSFPFTATSVTVTSPAVNEARSESESQSPSLLVAKILEIKHKLEKNQLASAILQSEQFTSVPTSDCSLDLAELWNEVLGVSELFRQKKKYIICNRMLRWAANLASSFVEPRLQLSKMKECCGAIFKVAGTMSLLGGMESEIEQLSLTLLTKIHEKIMSMEVEDTQLQAVTESWCLFYVGVCNGLIDRHEQANEQYKACISLMLGALGENAKNNEVFARCFHLSAAANRSMGKYVIAVEQYKQALKLWKSAEGINEKDRRKRIDYIEAFLKSAKISKRSRFRRFLCYTKPISKQESLESLFFLNL